MKSLSEVGKHFGMHNCSTVSSVVVRVKVRANEDRMVREHLDVIRVKVVKSQRPT